ncbi:hypothetical protein AWC05_18255 [Mycobacterium florentinum]|uniref:DUF4386 domain-containing protein n=1 Tax=Mycobacterium florentinum TaxID=292462 RepID=A0A1X1UCK4_MYCFL|nr:hypothetical protein [Mycobacterium florentinum]MCV7412563.1 hypothetical protein [Mycobacterium florentinum]ORV54534.1 hypothetical protein AWC05_18255 [Mycobacterium florentinum]BBX81946.1 hypothetical protein MFLOJ_57330 [Mycobacterium florentinum]
MNDARLLKVGIWSGPAMAVVTLVGAVLVGRFIPPFMEPSSAAAVVAAKYAEHATSVRIGAIVSAIGLALIAPFGAALAAQTRPAEGARPFLTYVQIASVAVASVFVVLACTIWALTAFRPGDYPPEIVRYSNDLAYFLFIFTWPPFTVWFIAIALAAFKDGERAPFPRWSGYLCLWLAVQISAGALIAFFKAGPFAYNGLFALYLPVALFFVWVVAMTFVMLRNLSGERRVTEYQTGP